MLDKDKSVPAVMVFRGAKGAEIRMFTDKLFGFRAQYHDKGKPYYLIDFWNGFADHPIDKYKHHGYQSLDLEAIR